ncbi:alkaline shock response membrane anchor protein AmaP [Schnuerera sp. xch1]|uniref:alkaline shock response membrane anchor protein AmaP n=1 Tax=Schnuerera sp. xch1 TaxID=2874283 RepID=UPI001CBDAB81|nr:alkaline shock response membrane anchor protein AmaP [Schnuerera sp. xch1]MBZ2173751.1 alkaline shock response membrane anchor protein AmaP [Schnuerera sp. xch1]
MSIFNRIILLIFSLLVGIISIIMMIFPFKQISFLSVNNLTYYLELIKGNYLLSVIGLIILVLSIKMLLLSIKFDNKEKNLTYLIKMTDHGEIKISSNTVSGLVQYIADKFTGIRNINTKVNIVEGQLFINLKGDVTPEINIPEMTNDLQAKVKEHVQNCTGVKVTNIEVIISNTITPVRNIK